MRETLPELREVADAFVRGAALANFSEFLVGLDDLPGAVEAAREAIASIAPHERNFNYVTYAIEHLALVCAQRSDLPGGGPRPLLRRGTHTYRRSARLQRPGKP